MLKLATFIPEQPEQTATDVQAHAAASYVRPAAEHERPKTPPLPSRPRSPHPHAALTPAR